MEAACEFPPEFELLLDCARRRLAPDRAERVGYLVGRVADWNHLLALAARHGLMPLLCLHLEEQSAPGAPPAAMAELRERRRESTMRSLFLAAELLKVLEMFRAHGVPALPYKGPVLSLLAYGALGLRESVDLDILIRKEDVRRARGLLFSLGYRSKPPLSDAQLAAILRFDYEAPVVRDEDQSMVDLQWAAPPRFLSLPVESVEFGPNSLDVQLAGRCVRTLSREDLLLALCSHGAKHMWSTLLWIADVAALCEPPAVVDWERLLAQASAFRRRRVLLLGLFLARRLIGTAFPETIERGIDGDPAVAALGSQVIGGLFSAETSEVGVQLQTRFLAASLDRRRDAARFLLRLAVTPTPGDWEALSLPPWLMAGYYLVRPFRLAGKYLLGRDAKP